MGTAPARFEVVIIGAGFSGIAMGARLLRDGVTNFTILEKGHDVGGTWRDNTYPGCACDVPSLLYSLSFAPNANWTSTFSPQPEIQAYLQRTATALGLMSHVRLNAEMTRATWDAGNALWSIDTTAGSLAARILIVAPGPLSEPSIPLLPGLHDFAGTAFHSARWDHGHDLHGRRVAVIGTGASAIQFIPRIQKQVARLSVFQRTPPWVIPRPARRFSAFESAAYRRFPFVQRLMRTAIYWMRDLYAIPLLRSSLTPLARRLGEKHMERAVADPDLRRRLTPNYAPGCKRILLSNDYFPAMASSNVDLVTDPIREVVPEGIVTADGRLHDVDTIIFGTGFHVTDVPIANRIHGRDSRSMAEAAGPSLHAHRGTAMAGFPNLFLILGPNTGLGHTSVVAMAEAQVAYIARAMRRMRRAGSTVIEVKPEAETDWNERVQRKLRGTVWAEGGCSSWYVDAHGRNTTIWPSFASHFAAIMHRFDHASYRTA